MPARTALVTGGNGGLGRAVVATLLDAGWRVVVPVRADAGLAPHPNLTIVRADLTNPADVERAVAAAAAGSSPLRAVANLVGGFAAGPKVVDTPYEEVERLLALNLKPTHLVTRAALPHLAAAGGGAIVCTAAAAAREPFAGGAAYAASKAAVLAFSRALAKEGAPDGIRCNAILPTLIDTPANRGSMPESQWHKLVPPERIARTVAFLCDDASAAVNGAELLV
jgi:NAD(P)-dependent dehydrogenase (short-subunit alcohol dehydrogenase family)